MGIIITKRNDLYTLKSSVSDEKLHKEDQVTESDAASILASRAIYDGVSKALEYFNDFPGGWTVNSKRVPYKNEMFLSQQLANWNNKEWNKQKNNELLASGAFNFLFENSDYKLVKKKKK